MSFWAKDAVETVGASAVDVSTSLAAKHSGRIGQVIHKDGHTIIDLEGDLEF